LHNPLDPFRFLVSSFMLPGTRIDDFTVAYRIASGMNADVFAVWHHTLCAPLICKRLRADDWENRKWRRLLLSEGAALARLNHPGIVRLIERRTRAALPYLLLEHVGERTLRDELRERVRFPIAAAVRVVQHVCAAVAYMHDNGYLHRDIKPSNVIMRNARPVLLDFGVVWRIGNSNHAARRPPDRCGTPQRLAPEQIHRQTLSPATDVFGLGMLLYELLTGERPFPVSRLLHDRAAPLSARYTQLTHTPRTLRAFGCDAHAELETVLMRALAPNPADRFATARDLLFALDPFTSTKIYPADATTADAALKANGKP
jgi:serine/threonine-protein kinase